jgi:hypothetical protein
MFCKFAYEQGGGTVPLILNYSDSQGTGLMNPSIFNDNGKLLVNVRHVNYAIYHCHNFFHKYGPLQYIHAEHQMVLKTTNFMCELNNDLTINQYNKVDTSNLDSEPQWEFIGLEDARLVKWNGELKLIGVRRDNNTTGKGRMEVSTITSKFPYHEKKRFIIEPPVDSYCEKNWMPILDAPFKFVKWTSPTEIITYDNGRAASIIHLGYNNYLPFDLRGGSQVLSYKDHYIAVVHEAANLKSELNQKDAQYRHRIVVWDKNFNITKITPSFDFLNGEIEFCTGMCIYNDNFVLSFGRQDNSAYLVHLPTKSMENFIWKN